MDIDKAKNLDQCRICLKNFEEMLNMFEDDFTTVKLALCCGVGILNIPTLSSNICKKCFDILNMAYDFRVLCQRSQEYLSGTQNALDPDYYDLKLDFAEIHEASCMDQDDVKNKDRYQQNYSKEEDQEEEETNAEMVKGEAKESENLEHSKESDEIDYPIKTKEEVKVDVTTYLKNRRNRAPKAKAVFMCNFCGNIYKNKATFNYHMKLHQNDKKYECEICSKRFMQTCDLQAHIRIHTGEKPFSCSYCDRKFTDRGGVTRHERTHTNERPYVCNICGANFSYSTTLKKHKRVHTGEKPFKCMICIKQFSESHQLKAHLTTIRHTEKAREKSKTPLLT